MPQRSEDSITHGMEGGRMGVYPKMVGEVREEGSVEGATSICVEFTGAVCTVERRPARHESSLSEERDECTPMT